ncbi:AgmX/PglI C-terminal domain-containing protein [Kaarinaea lacus]
MRSLYVALCLALAFTFTSLQAKPKSNADHIPTLIQAAEKGRPYAQYKLGTYYERGVIQPKSVEKAFFWYQKAAESGHPNAQYAVGRMYLHGHGVEKDTQAAYFWLKNAALQGRVQAQLLLAKMYKDHEDIQENKLESYAWLMVASLYGNKKATNLTIEMERQMSEEELINGQQMGDAYYKLILKNMKRVNRTAIGSIKYKGANQTAGTNNSLGEFSKIMDEYKAFYRSESKRYGKSNQVLKGEIVFEITITAKGDVSKCSVIKDEINDSQFTRELINKIKMFKFPPQKNADELIITYPLVF